MNTGTDADNVLIISDIEGSSGCWDYEASSFMGNGWPEACLEMTRDVNAVVTALLDAGIRHVTVKDFHRTGYNLLQESIDGRARVVSGYRQRPVPGIGDPGNAQAAIFLGMHGASGSDAFLPHTLTSRIARLEVNGRLMPEIELFSASLAPLGIRPLFFSGCPAACAQAVRAVPGIATYPIDKSDGRTAFDARAWRTGLARAAVRSLRYTETSPYIPRGPFKAVLTMRDGEQAARSLARRWGLVRKGPRIFLEAPHIHALYQALIRLCYMTPLIEKMLPLGLWVSNIRGRMGLEWVRRQLRNRSLPSVREPRIRRKG